MVNFPKALLSKKSMHNDSSILLNFILGEDNLMPEADFLARNVSPVTFRVVVPNMPDKPEWKLHGQTIGKLNF